MNIERVEELFKVKTGKLVSFATNLIKEGHYKQAYILLKRNNLMNRPAAKDIPQEVIDQMSTLNLESKSPDHFGPVYQNKIELSKSVQTRFIS